MCVNKILIKSKNSMQFLIKNIGKILLFVRNNFENMEKLKKFFKYTLHFMSTERYITSAVKIAR